MPQTQYSTTLRCIHDFPTGMPLIWSCQFCHMVSCPTMKRLVFFSSSSVKHSFVHAEAITWKPRRFEGCKTIRDLRTAWTHSYCLKLNAGELARQPPPPPLAAPLAYASKRKVTPCCLAVQEIERLIRIHDIKQLTLAHSTPFHDEVMVLISALTASALTSPTGHFPSGSMALSYQARGIKTSAISEIFKTRRLVVTPSNIRIKGFYLDMSWSIALTRSVNTIGNLLEFPQRQVMAYGHSK